MSNSKKLSETRTGQIISNDESVSQEKRVRTAVKKVYNYLKRTYPDITFQLESSVNKFELGKKLNNIHPKLGTFTSSRKSGFRPDGGFLYAWFDGKKKLILSVEAKKQGTNDIRMASGEDQQAKGNAIERSPKTYGEVVIMQLNEEIFPYLIFVSGCDFAKGSTITDRITGMNYQSDINELYIQKLRVKLDWGETLLPRASLFVRKRQWGTQSIYNACLEAVEISIAHHSK